MPQGGSFLLYEGKEGDPFWTKAETLLYCALIAYIIFEAPAEDRNINTLVDMISGMEVKEDDENYLNAVDYMFKGLEKRKPDCFAVKQYRKYKLSSGKTAKSILISCGPAARRKILCKRFSTKSRMALENRADSGLDPLITESHGGQNGMCAGTA